MGSPLLASGACRPELPPPALDYTLLGVSLSLRGHAYSGSSLSALDHAHLGSFLLAKSSCQLGLSPSVPDSLHPGVAPSMQSSVHLELLVPVLGLTRLGPVFPLLVTESAHLDAFLALRSMGQLDVALLVIDFLHSEPTLLPQSWTHLDSSLSVPDHLKLGSSPLLRSYTQSESTPASFGVVRTALTPLILECARAELSVPLHSFSCLGVPAPVPDSLQIDAFVFLQQLAQPGSTLSICGASCLEFTMSLLDHASPGPVVFLRSLAQPGSGMLVLDFLHLDPSFPARATMRMGPAMLVFSRTRPDLPLFPPDVSIMGSAPFPRTFARSGLATSMLDFMTAEVFLSPRSYG